MILVYITKPQRKIKVHWVIPVNINTPPMDDNGNPVRNAQ